MPRPPRSDCPLRPALQATRAVPGTLSGIRTGSLGAGSVGVGVGVPLPDWESSPEYRWVPSRVDEHESRGISLIEKAGLPDQLTAVLLKQRLHFLQNSVR